MADPGKYRTKEEVESWKARDPLLLAEQRVARDFAELAPRLKEISDEVEATVQDAVKFAHESPDPDPSTVEEYTLIGE